VVWGGGDGGPEGLLAGVAGFSKAAVRLGSVNLGRPVNGGPRPGATVVVRRKDGGVYEAVPEVDVSVGIAGACCFGVAVFMDREGLATRTSEGVNIWLCLMPLFSSVADSPYSLGRVGLDEIRSGLGPPALFLVSEVSTSVSNVERQGYIK
jgi:hypothetical protein